MIDYLLDVERRLPMLLQSMDGWSTRFVTYEKPHVERLFRDDGPNRIYLHRIHKCTEAEAFLHVHPWPSAIRVLSGSYEMRLGLDVNLYEDSLSGLHDDYRGQSYLQAARLVLGKDSLYEMDNQDAMHSVRPLTDETLSLMVTGPIWFKSTPDQKQNADLSKEQAEALLNDFRILYST